MSENKAEAPAPADLAWGIHPVLELLRSSPQHLREVVIQKGKGGPKLQEIISLARENGLKIRFEQTLRLPPPFRNENHQGVLAKISSQPTIRLEELLAALRGEAAPVVLALDSIQDPHNLGAIIRSASAAGVAGIVLPKDRSAPLTGTVGKTAAGALAHMRICQVTNLAAALKRLREEGGFWIFGAAGGASRSIYETEFTGTPVCLVIGGEEKGLRPLIREHCDQLVSIPMQGPLESLNAAAATTVILFEMVRQRLRQGAKTDPPRHPAAISD